MNGPTPEQFERLDRLFNELVDASREVRERRLAEIAPEDQALHDELLDMLGEATSPGVNVLVEQAAALAGQGTQGVRAASATTLGRYTLMRLIGSGGMGEVWEAEQTEPVQRRVAVKILLGSSAGGGGGGAGRFLAERQALATMDHPNIARVIDGGETPEGRPYFVMELVREAVSLTGYCAEHKFSLDQRLELFLPICEAIEHAHRKRMIHRDLKPSNVLVTEIEGRAVPKVIDFGIAKPMDEVLLGGETAATKIGELVGTPQYMSPEQASLGAVDIDTRSDVYTLGLLLYELVVGQLPRPMREMCDLSFGELCRVIQEEDAPRPSTRVRQLGGTTQAGTTWRRIQGDLDRILAKALAKDRDQRYGSALALAEDIRRFLANEPVLATPPSLNYRAQKFFGRNRVPVALGVLAVLAIATALVGTTFGLLKAREAEQQAQIEASTAIRVSAFLEELLREGNPEQATGQAMSVNELVALGSEKIRAQLADEPAVRSRLLYTIASAHLALGEFDSAVELLDESIALRTDLYGDVSKEVEQALDEKGEALQRMGRLDEALEVAKRQKAVADAVYAETDPRFASSVVQLGMIHWRRGEYGLALEMLEQGLVTQEAGLGPEHIDLVPLLNNVAILYWQAARYDEASPLYERALEILEREHGSEHPFVASTLNNLALVKLNINALEEARAAQARALDIRRKIFSEPHPDIAESLNNLGAVQYALGEFDVGIENTEKALAMRREIYDGPNDYVATSLLNVGRYKSSQGDSTARALILEAKSMFTTTLGPEHSHLAEVEFALSLFEQKHGDLLRAAEHAGRATAIIEKALGPEHPSMEKMLGVWSQVLIELGSDQAPEVTDRLEALRTKLAAGSAAASEGQ